MVRDGSNEDDDQRGDIRSELKLQEFANVIKGGSAPHDALHNGGEIVVENDNIGRLSSNLRS